MTQQASALDLDVPDAARWRNRFIALVAALLAVGLAVGGYLFVRFAGDVPVDYAGDEDHFKYGSTGGEHESGFPLRIWQVLPTVCAEHLPGPGGYASLGLVYENDADGKPRALPVGMSQRRYQGIDRVFLNCAACHASTVRKSPGDAPRVVAGMPANGFNLMAFEKFFFRCAADPKFTKERILPEIERTSGPLEPLDRYLVYPLAIAIMRDRTLQLAGRFEWVNGQHDWGPGRVDTFNSAKVLFNFPLACKPGAPCVDERELNAPGDFPAVWNQAAKQGMQLHWDGNNNLFQERDKSAAFGTGTTPPTLDLKRIARVEQWLLEAKPLGYDKLFPIDQALAAKGAATYKAYCAGCHGANGQSFALPEAQRSTDCVKPGDDEARLYGPEVGKITPLAQIGTDRRRLDSYTRDLAVNQATLYAGYDWRFCHFRKTFGYANMPLDGLWLRAPYLHNGSVPTLRDLLEPAAKRPPEFYRGNDVYDPQRVGFVASAASDASGRRFFRYDTRVPGNSNAGHEGKAYGTELADDEKAALVEFLKTF